jgi:hypothetical protein
LRSPAHRGLRRLAGALRSPPSYVDRRPISFHAERRHGKSRERRRGAIAKEHNRAVGIATVAAGEHRRSHVPPPRCSLSES